MPHLRRMIRVGEIQRLDDVRPTAFHEHHGLAADIFDDQRLSFMAAQRTARLRPHICRSLTLLALMLASVL